MSPSERALPFPGNAIINLNHCHINLLSGVSLLPLLSVASIAVLVVVVAVVGCY